ncbi:hypothetical protein HMPREF1429_00415 [Helicobacter pylori GAM93Bi]|nr:hypothetical protein HMPREF1429_00415 [Helicobacter pylori GAM93Bi]
MIIKYERAYTQAVILKSTIKGYGEHGFKITPYPFKNFTMKQSLKHHIKTKQGRFI